MTRESTGQGDAGVSSGSQTQKTSASAPAPRRVRLKPEDRRSRILAEALRLIGERGYYGFGIRELAERCAMTVSGMLHYFGSKDRLLIALLEDRDRTETESMRALAAGKMPPARTARDVVALLRAIIARSIANPELVRLFSILESEALNDTHPAHQYFLKRRAATLTGVARMLAPFDLQPDSTALQLTLLMRGLEVEWLRSGRSLDVLAEWDRAVAKLFPAAAPG